MTSSGRGTARRDRWSWSSMSQVEVVGLYTRQSLYLILVATTGLLLIASINQLDDSAAVVGLLAGGAIVTGVAMWTMSVIMQRWPTVWPLPQPQTALLLIVTTAYSVGALLWLPADPRSSALVVSVLALSISLGALPDQRIAAAIIAAGAVESFLNDPGPWAWIPGAIFAVAFIVTARVSMWLYGIVLDLDAARSAQSELAVMEERLRFSRDVHDVLGRRLSTIAVQAELAATFAQRGDDRAAERMLEVRAVAHQALREARELARGYRATDFAQELDGARSLLRAAGIDVVLHVDGLPRAWEEPAGWVVREAVTNILRHSRAATVQITFADHRLQVVNDGVDRGGSASRGAAAADEIAVGFDRGIGLQSLRERLAPLGAMLDAGPTAGGWHVGATFPAAGPLSAHATNGGRA